MIRSGLILMIKELARKGKSAYSIGREIGVSKNTARKYITQPVQPHGLKGVRKGSKLDPYKPQLNIWMQQGIFNCVVLLERLRALGYGPAGAFRLRRKYPYPPDKNHGICLSPHTSASCRSRMAARQQIGVRGSDLPPLGYEYPACSQLSLSASHSRTGRFYDPKYTILREIFFSLKAAYRKNAR